MASTEYTEKEDEFLEVRRPRIQNFIRGTCLPSDGTFLCFRKTNHVVISCSLWICTRDRVLDVN